MIYYICIFIFNINILGDADCNSHKYLPAAPSGTVGVGGGDGALGGGLAGNDASCGICCQYGRGKQTMKKIN